MQSQLQQSDFPQPELHGYPASASVSEWFEIQTFHNRHPHVLTRPRVQWLMRARVINGLDKCVVKIGRSLFIHEPSFLKWMDSQRGKEL